MRITKAFTARDGDDLPCVVFEFAKHPSAVADIFQKRAVVNAGIVVLFPLDEDGDLSGFETIDAEIDDVQVTFPAEGGCAATRDPLVVDLTRKFLRSTDDLTFKPDVQLFPTT